MRLRPSSAYRVIQVVAVIAISCGFLISGLGRLLVHSVNRRDLPVTQAVAIVTVFDYVMANSTADLLYAYLNPRIRLGE